jgi:hypothetical protein
MRFLSVNVRQQNGVPVRSFQLGFSLTAVTNEPLGLGTSKFCFMLGFRHNCNLVRSSLDYKSSFANRGVLFNFVVVSNKLSVDRSYT